MQIRVDAGYGPLRARKFKGDDAMKAIQGLLCMAWFLVFCACFAIAKETRPAEDAKPAAITVLKDATPVMYGRSAKIKATVEAVDLDAREITLKVLKGRLITLRVEERVRNLPQVQVGDEVIVRYHESVGLQLRRTETGEPGTSGETSASAEAGQKPASVAAVQFTVAAYVETVSPKEKTLTLRRTDGNLVDLYVRDQNVLESLSAGDSVVATYTEAVAVSIELPKKKEKPKPKKRKPSGASAQ